MDAVTPVTGVTTPPCLTLDGGMSETGNVGGSVSPACTREISFIDCTSVCDKEVQQLI